VVPAAGVEPATFRSGGERSNPLSYAGLNKMACFKETNQECPPFCPPFLTVFVPLVKYRAAADNGPDRRAVVVTLVGTGCEIITASKLR
jgi:hypothetical protein